MKSTFCRWPLLSALALIGLPLVCASAQTPAPAAFHFTKIGIKHYDAGVIAHLITAPSGIIVVPPNFVIPANSPSPAAPVAPAAPASVSVLPEGVRRIFVLQSDNSLVIEATADGLARLSL